MMVRRRLKFNYAIAFVFALTTCVAGFTPQSFAADITGSTYTSSTYGVTFTWDDMWFLIGEDSAEYDSVMLTDGLTYASFYAGPDGATTPESSLAGTMISSRNESGVSDFAAMKDGDGNIIRGTIGERAYAAFSFTQTFEDDSSEQFVLYIDLQLIVPGESSTGFVAYIPLASFDTELSLVQTLAGSVRLLDTLPDPEIHGETAPVFVAGFWRIAVVTTILSEEIPTANLKPREDSEWLVVIADVTNWSTIDSELPLRDFRLTGDGFTKSLRAAPKSSISVAKQLAFDQPNADLVLTFAAEETVRVALVFSMPDGGLAPRLRLDDVAIPLADTLQSTLVLEDLRASGGPPETREGEILSASDGRTVRIQFTGETEPTRIRLLGVEPPAEGTCFEHEAENLLDNLAGTTVIVESDFALAEAKTPARYLWAVNPDGSRTLLNQKLIAEGLAEAATLPGDARFGLWFVETESAATQASSGLWTGCDNPDVSRNSRSNPAAAATATAAGSSTSHTTATFVTPEPDDEN